MGVVSVGFSLEGKQTQLPLLQEQWFCPVYQMYSSHLDKLIYLFFFLPHTFQLW